MWVLPKDCRRGEGKEKERNRTEQNGTDHHYNNKKKKKKKTVECYFSFHTMTRVPVVMFHSIIVQMRPRWYVRFAIPVVTQPASISPPDHPFSTPSLYHLSTYLPMQLAWPDLNFPVRSTPPILWHGITPMLRMCATCSAVPHQHSTVPYGTSTSIMEIWNYLRLTCIQQTGMVWRTGNLVVCLLSLINFGLVILLYWPLLYHMRI